MSIYRKRQSFGKSKVQIDPVPSLVMEPNLRLGFKTTSIWILKIGPRNGLVVFPLWFVCLFHEDVRHHAKHFLGVFYSLACLHIVAVKVPWWIEPRCCRWNTKARRPPDGLNKYSQLLSMSIISAPVARVNSQALHNPAITSQNSFYYKSRQGKEREE